MKGLLKEHAFDLKNVKEKETVKKEDPEARFASTRMLMGQKCVEADVGCRLPPPFTKSARRPPRDCEELPGRHLVLRLQGVRM